MEQRKNEKKKLNSRGAEVKKLFTPGKLASSGASLTFSHAATRLQHREISVTCTRRSGKVLNLHPNVGGRLLFDKIVVSPSENLPAEVERHNSTEKV
jgi:hypothetical protein